MSPSLRPLLKWRRPRRRRRRRRKEIHYGREYEGDTCPAQTYGGRNACMYMRRREKEIISRDDVNKQMATFANRL